MSADGYMLIVPAAVFPPYLVSALRKLAVEVLNG